MTVLDLLKSGLAPANPSGFHERVEFYENSGVYRNTSVFRGFPIGSIGSGGFGIGTQGGFVDLRINNNWMNPVKHAKGSFWAVSCLQNNRRATRILRRSFSGGKEYTNIQPIHDVLFSGEIPSFKQEFLDEFPVHVSVQGFSPLIPQNIKDSSLPAAVFYIDLQNLSIGTVEASFLFSWENILGCGGTGHRGGVNRPGRPIGMREKLTYNDRNGNDEQEIYLNGLKGLKYFTTQQWPENSHRQGVLGQYLLLVEEQPGVDITLAPKWDASESTPDLLENFCRTGNIPTAFEATKRKPIRVPAGAIQTTTLLKPKENRRLTFYLIWWTPNHFTEKIVSTRVLSRKHKSNRVGHYYENHFSNPEDLAVYLVTENNRLFTESMELPRLVASSKMPEWIKRSLVNSVDSMICNTVLPKDSGFYTIEEVDTDGVYGGLTGAIDQRLFSQAYASTFFPELDRLEMDSFRKLSRNGLIPHNNGNCDIDLGNAEIPFSWTKGSYPIFKEKHWPDLIYAYILLVYRYYRITGDQPWVIERWPDLMKMLSTMKNWSKDGLPLGGSSFEKWSISPSSIYLAGLYLTTLEALMDIAQEIDPEVEAEILDLYQVTTKYIQKNLWNDNEKYYQSSEKKKSNFSGSLAGDWYACYTGLSPILPTENTRAHLKHFYEAGLKDNIGMTGSAAYPLSEINTETGTIRNRITTLKKVPSPAWQMVAYYGLEAIYKNLVNEGLETIRMLYDRIWELGWPWSADIYGNAGSISMSHPVLWALPNALAGVSLDVPHSSINFSPRQIPDFLQQSIPVCFPAFWAMLNIDWDSSTATLEIMKHFGQPLRLHRLTVSNSERIIRDHKLKPIWRMEAGQRFEFPIDIKK